MPPKLISLYETVSCVDPDQKNHHTLCLSFRCIQILNSAYVNTWVNQALVLLRTYGLKLVYLDKSQTQGAGGVTMEMSLLIQNANCKLYYSPR